MDVGGNKWPSHLSVVFWDGFDAMNAIRVLALSGFTTQEIRVLGVLAESVPDLGPALLELGLSESESGFFRELFDEGAIVLVVRAHQTERYKIAARLMKQCGGLPAHNNVLH